MGFSIILVACNKVPDYTIASKHNYINGTCSECGFTASLWDGTSLAMGFNSGSGTSDNPYTIKTASELIYFSRTSQNISYSDKYVRLDNNIDLMGNEWTPIKNFRGCFDGNGHSISSFVISKNNDYDNGLFGVVEGVIRNLKADNFYIGFYSDTSSYYIRAGGIAGYLEAGLVENCAVENAKFYIKSKTNIVIGGIVGGEYGASMTSTVVRNCYAKDVDVFGYTTRRGCTCALGGIVGKTDVSVYTAMGTAYVQNCYSTGKIEAKYKYSESYKNRGAECGGIIGDMSCGVVQTSFSDCSISVDAKDDRYRIGRIAVNPDARIQDCYGTEDQVFTAGGKQITNNDLFDSKSASVASKLGIIVILKQSWNNSIWTFDNLGYPQLSLFSNKPRYCA